MILSPHRLKVKSSTPFSARVCYTVLISSLKMDICYPFSLWILVGGIFHCFSELNIDWIIWRATLEADIAIFRQVFNAYRYSIMPLRVLGVTVLILENAA